MRVLLAVVASTGCHLVFPLEPSPNDAPLDDATPDDARCSPASLIRDPFTDTAPLGRPWQLGGVAAARQANELGDRLELRVADGALDVIAEPFLDLRDHEYAVTLSFTAGQISEGDRATLDLLTEDGRHRLSYGLVTDAMGALALTAEYVTFEAGTPTLTSIGKRAYPIASTPAKLAIRQEGALTSFVLDNAVVFDTALVALDWIAYMRPILHVSSASGENVFVARDFNTTVPVEGVACPASQIDETFEPDLSSRWQAVTPDDNCAIAVDAGGSLRMELSAGDAIHECIIHTSTVYDLRGHQVELVVDEVVPAAATFMRVDLEVETRTARARLRLDVPVQMMRAMVGELGAERSVGDRPIQLAQIATFRNWRISGTADDRLLFEVGDGTTLIPVGQTQRLDVGTLDQVRIRVIAFGAGDGTGSRAAFKEIKAL